MRPAEDIKRLIKNLTDKTSAQMDERVLKDVLFALEESEKTSALTWSNIRRTIMKNPITKLAAAAAVIAVVVLGLFEFIDTSNKSGVVWAEVAQKVQASRGVIYRRTETSSDLPNGADYSITYDSPTRSRTDVYKGGQITASKYADFDAKTFTAVYHTHKAYLRITIDEQAVQEHQNWMNPKWLVQEFLSCEHRKLGHKTIDGVLCEGIETTDPTIVTDGNPNSNITVNSFMARIWVSVETDYPVLLEGEVTVTGGDVGKRHIAGIVDQFQWNVEPDASLYEPNIPQDYKEM